jgi:hypothetical protein
MKLTRFENNWNGLSCNLKPFFQYFKTKNYYIGALISTLQQLWEILLDVGLGCNDDFRCLYLTTITNQNLIMHYVLTPRNISWFSQTIIDIINLYCMTKECHVNVTNYTHLKFEHLDNLVIACHKIWTINKNL